MISLVTAIALGFLYCFVSFAVVGHYRRSKFVDLSFFAYVVASPSVVSVFTNQDSSIFLFALGVLVSILLLSSISLLIDMAIFQPILSLNQVKKTMVGISVFLVLITYLDVIGTDGNRLDSPFSDMTITAPDNSTGLFIIVFSSIVLLALYVFLYRTVLGTKFRAHVLDARTSSTCGIKDFSNNIVSALITGVMATFSGVGFALINSDKSFSASVLPYATIAIAVVIIAQLQDFRLCLFGSFVIAVLQIMTLKNLDSISSIIQSISSLVGIDTEIVESDNFAFWFLPFIFALLLVNIIPVKWVEDVQND